MLSTNQIELFAPGGFAPISTPTFRCEMCNARGGVTHTTFPHGQDIYTSPPCLVRAVCAACRPVVPLSHIEFFMTHKVVPLANVPEEVNVPRASGDINAGSLRGSMRLCDGGIVVPLEFYQDDGVKYWKTVRLADFIRVNPTFSATLDMPLPPYDPTVLPITQATYDAFCAKRHAHAANIALAAAGLLPALSCHDRLPA